MRVLIAIALLLVPLSGCLGGVSLLETDLFDYIEVERGDPTPVPLDDCSVLLDTLNLRAQQQALVSLHQSYVSETEYGRHGFFGGEVDVAMDMEESSDDSARGSTSAAAAPESAPAGDGADFAASDADVTGTNNQEQGVDEADILKTDGEWTYAIDGRTLQIMHSTTVGNLSLHASVPLGDGSQSYWYGHGTQLLLVDRGNDDPSDDRIVAILNGVPTPLDEQGEPYYKEGRSSDGMSEDIAYYPYYGGSYSAVYVYDLGDRSDPQLVSQHYIEGDNVAARLVDGVVYTVIHQYQPYLDLRSWAGPDDELLRQHGMDWEDYYQASPEERKELLLESVQKSIAHNDAVLANTTLADHLPTILHPDGGKNVRPQSYDEAYCTSVLTTLDDMGRSVSTILSLDVGADDMPYQTKQILGGGYPLVYGAQDALVLASTSQEFWWFWAQPDLDEATNLHWFDLDGLDVSHRASGRVDGIVQDQFGIDVHADQLRIATTTGTWGRWWLEDPEPMQNHIFVFEEVGGLLVPMGSVTGFAEEERIWSARFTDDRAYIVTFRQIDPLWIIDLSDPRDPQILGELEIPGVSTYIHPLPGEDALLTIGIGPRDDGGARETCPDTDDCVASDEPVQQGLDWNRIQISLFDISDPNNPVRADVHDVTLPAEDEYSDDGSYSSYSWGYSSALHEHKAFNYWDKLGMLAVPVSWHHYENSCSQEGGKRTCVSTEEFHTGLDLIDVDLDAMTLEKYGSVDQDHLMTDEGNQYGWYWGAEVQRSYFIGFPDEYPDKPVSVVAYSSIGLSVHDLATLTDQDAVRFHGQDPYYYEEEVDEEQPILEEIPEPATPMPAAA